MTHICIYNAHVWVSSSLLVINMSCPHVILWHNICCVHLHQLVMNFLQCDTLHTQSQVTAHFNIDDVSSRPAICQFSVWWYNAYGAVSWLRKIYVCPLHSEICIQMMLFNMGHAVSLFSKHPFVSVLWCDGKRGWNSVAYIWMSSVHSWVSVAHDSGFSSCMGQWVQFMYGTLWQITVCSVCGWDIVTHYSGFSIWLGHCDTLQWVQFMAGILWHITVGSVYGWDIVTHYSGFSLWLGQCDTLQWVQFVAGTLWHITVGSVSGWDIVTHYSGFGLWLGHCDTLQWVQFMAGREIGEDTQNSGHMRSAYRTVKALSLLQPPWWKSPLDEDESHNRVLSLILNHAAVCTHTRAVCTHKWSCPSMKRLFLCYIKYYFQPIICINR
jgi:hypothetical protein